MRQAWIDANIVLRHLTQEPPDQARQVSALLRSAQEGRVVLWIDPVTIAECVWVLASVYHVPRGEIAGALADFVAADGIGSEDREMLVQALSVYAANNVDFADALLASRMAQRGISDVFSFDRDFDRLPYVVRHDPGEVQSASEVGRSTHHPQGAAPYDPQRHRSEPASRTLRAHRFGAAQRKQPSGVLPVGAA